MSQISLVPALRIRTALVYAGGTISSSKATGGYLRGDTASIIDVRLSKVFQAVPGAYDIAKTEAAYSGLSENIDYEIWADILKAVKDALATNPKAIIVTHGTDSMEHTARFLEKELGELIKQTGTQIILTGANIDLSNPKTDVWENLNFVFRTIRDNNDPGVYIAFHNKLIPASLAIKEPFNGSGMNFVSKGDVEYIRAKLEQEGQDTEIIAKLKTQIGGNAGSQELIERYPVNVIRANHNIFLEHMKQRKVKAVLLVLYHGGTANTNKPETSVAKLVKDLRESNGIVFFAVTENGEPVDLHSYETSVKLLEAGVVPLYNMKEAVALAKLQMLSSEPPLQMIEKMLTNSAGEIDETRINLIDIERLKTLYTLYN